MAIVQIHATVKGRVQGVGFRNWTYSQARLFGVTGWVKNAPEGVVSILAEGDETNIGEFIEAIKQGPRLSKITEVAVQSKELESREYSDFQVVKE
jgi:acylphosphatase